MNKGLLIPLVFLLMFSSCSKDPLTLPSKVVFDFELISHEEGAGLKSGFPIDPPFGKITVDQGTLVISSIEFDGRRDQGRDVFFVSDLQEPVIVDLEKGDSSMELSFDIPQGVYNRIELFINLGNGDGTSLLLEGMIKKGRQAEIPVIFEYNIPEQIRVRAEPENKGNQIVLTRDKPSKARIIVDAGEVFQFVKLPVLQQATVSVLGDENIIIISPENNINIFNSMASRIERSFRVVFD